MSALEKPDSLHPPAVRAPTLFALGDALPEDLPIDPDASTDSLTGDLDGAPSLPSLLMLSAPDSADGQNGNRAAEGRRQRTAWEHPPADLPGYDILGLIGRGAMGLVYRARQQGLNRIVALKLLRAPLAGTEARARFRAEAEALARLDHTHIVHVYDAGEHDGQPYFTMEYVPGGSLDRKLRGTPLPAEPAARLVRGLALAMHAAHQAGIVHRDLKPANILLQKNDGSFGDLSDSDSDSSFVLDPSSFTTKITDFGLAKYQGEASGQTQDGVLMGTPSYMAPEQADGLTRDIGPRTDIWALGAILYELLTGRPPFRGVTVSATLEQVRSLDPVPPRRLQPNCPRDLNLICLKCLEKDPARRYPTAFALAEDLRHYLAGEPTQARPPGLLVRLLKWGRRHPSQALLSTVLVLATVLAVLAARWHIGVLARRVREARSGERKLLTSLGCERLLHQAEKALSGPSAVEWRAARDKCDQVLDTLSRVEARDEEEVTRLHDAERLRDQAVQQLRQADHQARARQDFETFFQHRDDAFFLLHRDLVGNGDADPADSRRAAEEALALFGWPARVPDPDQLSHYSSDEHKQLRSGLAEVFLLLAEALARSGRSGEALQVLDRAGCLLPAGALARSRARYQAGMGKPVVPITETTPQTALDWFLAGRDRLVQAGDARGAVHDLTRAIDRDKRLFWAYFLRALAWHRLKEGSAARLDLGACIGLRPNFAWSYLQRGFLRGQAGDREAAEEDFAQAAQKLEQAAPDPAARYVLLVNRGVLNLSRALPHDLGSFLSCVRATRQLQQAVALAPGRYHAYLSLAEAYVRLGQPNRAVTLLQGAIERIPDEPGLYRERAEIEFRPGQERAALADLDRADRLYAARGTSADADTRLLHADIQRRRADILYQLGLYPQAVLACQAALAHDAACPQTHRLLGSVWLALGCPEEALQALDKYLALCPRPDIDVFRERAQARIGLRQFGLLSQEYTRALALKPSSDLYAARGWALLVTEAPDPAREDFQAALRLNPTHAEARVGLASVLALAGDHRQAVREVDQALAQNAHPSARLLYKVVCVFVQAASAAAADPATDVRNCGPAIYQRRALAMLERTLQAEPLPRRRQLWHQQVLADNVLAPLRKLPDFERMAARYGR